MMFYIERKKEKEKEKERKEERKPQYTSGIIDNMAKKLNSFNQKK